MTTIDELLTYHKKRKERAEEEGLLGTVSQEIILIDQLEEIQIKTKI